MFHFLRTHTKQFHWRFTSHTGRRFRAFVALSAVVFGLWFLSEFVFAEKEAHVYVSPSNVVTEGWEGGELSLGQDLSMDAELADFSRENSAYVYFGASLEVGTTTEGEDVPTLEGVTPDTADTTPPPSEVPSEIIPNESVSTPNPFMPLLTPEEPSVSPTVTPADTVAPQGAPEAFLMQRVRHMFSGFLAGEKVLAQDVPEVAAAPSGDSSPIPELIETEEKVVSVVQSPDPSLEKNPLPVSAADAASSTQASGTPLAAVAESTQSPDPYSVSLCSTFGKTCHLAEYVGFGLGGTLEGKAVAGATLELSLAGRGAYSSGEYDRVLVRAYLAGRWEFLGSSEIRGELSNAKRAGYLKFELPNISTWDDLSDLKVVLEYDRASEEDAAVYVDGLWVNVRYQDTTLNSSAEEFALSGANIRSTLSARDAEARKARRDQLVTPEEGTILFTNGEAHEGQKLVIKSDKKTYHALGTMDAYVNVTNESTEAEVLKLQFRFQDEGATVRTLSRWSHNTPYQGSALKYDDVGYFCAAGWENESTRDSGSDAYSCVETRERATCDALNIEGTNCIAKGVGVGLETETRYRDGWTTLPITRGAIADESGIFTKAIDFLVAEMPVDLIPSSLRAESYLADSVLLNPGQTMYFRVTLDVPLNARGDLAIEAAAESGAYGLLHTDWGGSWNHRIPITWDSSAVSADGEFAIPVDFAGMSADFWEYVSASGSDIRFVDESGKIELPYWLAEFNSEEQRGLAWVRVPKLSAGATSSVYVYFGDQFATSRSNEFTPFRTTALTPRGVVFGGSQLDMTLHVLALAPHVRVEIEDQQSVTLEQGESALFSGIQPSTIVHADGPITASVIAVSPVAVYVPLGYAGEHFVLPGIGGERELAIAALDSEAVHGAIGVGGTVESIDPIFGSIVRRPITLSDSVLVDLDRDAVLTLVGGEGGAPTPIPSATTESLFGLALGKITVGVRNDGTDITALCASGARKSIDGRRAGASFVVDQCNSGPLDGAEAFRVDAHTQPIGGLMTPPESLLSILPRSLMGGSYRSPFDASHIALVCAPTPEPVLFGLYDEEGTMIASSTCHGRGNSPGATHFLPKSGVFPLGFTLRAVSGSVTQFLGMAIPAGTFSEAGVGMGRAGVRMLESAALSRAPGAALVTLQLGETEFVVPGEHRKLDVTDDGKDKEHVDTLLSKEREFSLHQKPTFRFQYKSQSSGLMQGVRKLLGVQSFTVARIMLRHPHFGDKPAEYDVKYGEGGEWSLQLKDDTGAVRPGKYTLHIEIEEGGDTYTDEFDFYWGVLAINYAKSISLPGERLDISLAALSNNGNTICDAPLKLWVTTPGGTETEVPVTASGKCNGNNVVDVPDYAAAYDIPLAATGTYKAKLVRLDVNENVASQVTDTFEVRDYVPYVIERVGPTRIFPLAHYPMKIRVRAIEAFEGNIVERIPGDFIVIDRGNATLAWGDDAHTFMTASWPTKLEAGGVVDFAYTFDAPDVSPYLYLMGPLSMGGEDDSFVEARKWQIASDAAGKMMLFWDDNVTIPATWTCVSCLTTDPFYERLPFGSSTYGGFGGVPTSTHSVTATVFNTGSTGVTENSVVNTLLAGISHAHTLSVSVGATSTVPLSRQLRVIQANSAGEPATIPAGAIALFDIASSSLPTGWNRYTPQDGYYPFGQNTAGTATGSNTHIHPMTGSSTVGVSPQRYRSRLGGTQSTPLPSAENHTHTLTATNTPLVNSEPPNVEMLFAKLATATGTSNYMITMWDNDPAAGWSRISDIGGTLNGKFVKASSTYGGTGGAVDHTYSDMTGAVTGASSESAPGRIGVQAAPTTHVHSVDLTGFSTESQLPRYVEVIFGKRLSGVPVFTQDSYRVYNNANLLTPTDPWPPGGSDLAENTPIETSLDSLKPTDKIRLRMNVSVGNATSTVGVQAFKLQYSSDPICESALNWSDVSPLASSTALWRGFNNTGVSDGATLTTLLLSSSTVAEAYAEENNSTTTRTQVPIGGVGEWDWVVQDNLAAPNTRYCFRMVKSDGTPLDTYVNYPLVLTNASPGVTVQSAPFSFEKVGTTTPSFQFTATDGEVNDLDYQVQISFSATFTTSVIDSDSLADPDLFENVDTPANKAPFNSGDKIQFKSATALTNGSTYWWRVRAKDSSGSNQWGEWSTARSLTVDTAVVVSTWHQTTRDQFQLDTLSGVHSTATDAVMLINGSTTGTIYSSAIDFNIKTIGSVWGNLRFSDSEVYGTVGYQIEYLTSTSSWALVPDTALPGNGAGFGASPVSLLSIDPTVYATIRIRANLTNTTGTPVLFDWTIDWGFTVGTPTLYLPFSNAKLNTTTPTFEWTAADPQGDPIEYEIQWSTTSAFTSSTTRNSGVNLGFQNIQNATDTTPFNSSDRIRFTIQPGDALIASSTYFWRVRGRDPTGANTYSFYSETRSFTVDLSITIATWFQTVDDQFRTDTLSSLRLTGTGSTTVATTTDEVMLAYGEGTVQTPRFRIFDGITLGGEQTALSVGATIQWVIVKSSPLISQYILGTLGSDRDTNFQVYESGAWANLQETGTAAPSPQRRSFDVAYETVSGRAIAVTCDSSPTAGYRIWTGSAWSATGTVNLSFATNCEWVRLASHPISNEIIGLFRNTGSMYEAQVWNATTSSWGNATVLGSMRDIAHEGMAVEYENSGTDAVVVASNGINASFVWKSWNGASWTATATVALGDDFESGNLRRNKTNDDMALCYIDQDNDIGVIRWTGSTNTWAAFTELEITGQSFNGRPVDCQYETISGRTNYIMVPYADTTGTRWRFWDGVLYQGERNMASTGGTTFPTSFTNQLVRTSASGTMLGMFFDHVGTDYEYAELVGSSTWENHQTIEDTASVTASPFGEPFYMAPQSPLSVGTIIGTPIDYDDGIAPAWQRVKWDATTPGETTFMTQVQYQNASGTWALIPDTLIPGNSVGTTTSPISITALDTTLYNVIRLKGTLTCMSGVCPTLNDWTVEWAAGVRISGTARLHDLTSTVTSGTVAVAVNGSLQVGRTGTIANGDWFIDNVTVFPGNTLTVFISGANDFNEAVTVAKYTGPGDMGGMRISERWVTIGSASTTGQSISLTDLAKYDNSVSGSEDIFYDIDAGNDFNNCVVGSCLDSSIHVFSNTFRPATSTSETINTWDMRVNGFLFADTNTIKVSGSWGNLGGFTSNASTVIFNGTSSTRTIDSTGAATSTFYNVTFGESGNTATWNLSSAFVATGTVAMSFGTTSQGTNDITLQGDLTIGASGTFIKGTATTTFSGTAARIWTDNTAAKQDLGNVVVNGTAKTLTLGSSVKATNIVIGADDTLSAGSAYTLTVLENWNNTGTFTSLTGTVDFAATTTGKTINQGVSNFYNTTFSGVGGTWIWQNTNATTTNDFAITGVGTTTLPSGTLAIGGSFSNTAGAFVHNSGVVRFTSTASGKNVRANGSLWNDILFAGAGGAWTFQDTNATTVGTFYITAGTPTLPSGTLEAGNTFDNQSGAFVANGGTLRMTSVLSGRIVRLSGSTLANFFVANAGGFTIADANATATGDVIFAAGTTTLPTANFAIGGNFSATGAFVSGSGAVHFNPASGTKTVSAGPSTFATVNVLATPTATISITGNATATAAFTLISGGFTQATATALAVGGTFTNNVGGASTTWTGTTLTLYSGTSYTLNTKTTGADSYATLRLALGTNVRMWNSSSNTYQFTPTSSMYSQDDSALDGSLFIGGNYIRTTGTDYWSFATDFDGTALGGSGRQVNVRFAPTATSSFTTNATLQIIGSTTASTTIDRATTGSFVVALSDATLNANYYQFRNMGARGLELAGTTTVTSLSYGDFEVATNGGSGITIASTTVDQNTGIQLFTVRFATTTAILAFNVTEIGTPAGSSFIRFRQHYGNIAGESNDNDPGGNPGYIRWDDSIFVISISGTVYSDAGVTPMSTTTCDNVTPNVRVRVNGLGNFAAPCSSANGTYTVPGVTFIGDTVMTVYLDTNGGRKATLVTRSASADLTGINLYQDRVIVRHEDTAALGIEHMNAYDAGNDSDISYSAATTGPNTLAVNPETEFWVWNAKTFIPNGNITLNSGGSGNNWDGTFHVDNNAIFTAQGNESHSVGGRFALDAGATFTAASSTFTFTATTTGKLLVGITPINFWNLVFNGSGGEWSVNQTTNTGNDLTVTQGTLVGANSMTISGVNMTGAGTVAMTGGSVTFANGGTFGGNTNWSFNNLNFGNGAGGTTTKTGSSTISIATIMTVTAGHTLNAGVPSAWNLTGGATPLVITGTLNPEVSVFRFSSTANTTVAAANYYRLYLAPSGAGGPTYSLSAGTFTVRNSLTVGDGVNSGTTTVTTNDPIVNVEGDLIIRSSATLVGSDSAAFNIYRDWYNQGTYTPSAGTVSFVATTTGRTITPSTSAFYNAAFNAAIGGWTILGNATTTNNFSITQVSSFVMASGTTLEVRGVFTNAVGGSATTWTGSTLYLNSGVTSAMNTKALGGDRYETLQVGGSTKISMWASSATTTAVAATGSLYSQNHASTSGELYIWGSYARTAGTDYWSYATDFDGTALGVSSRQANVRFATASSISISGTGALEILGTNTASTSLSIQTLGTYALNISGGSTTMKYVRFRGVDGNGLNFSGTPVVNLMDDVDFELGVAAGSMITVAGATIDANPLKIFSRNYFGTSTGVGSGFNVKATGVSASIWRFAGTPTSLGVLAGEAFDSDPGGDPGYIVWDDSAANITISGNVYGDEGITPVGGPTCDGSTQTVRLRVQGAGAYTSACNSTTGAFSISSVVFNPGDVLTLYLDTNSSTTAANVTVDPATNIANMHLYRDRVIVRHEGGTALSIANMNQYDSDQDTDIRFKATTGAPDTLVLPSNTTLIVWTSKVFAPAGDVTVHGNALGSDRDGTVKLYASSTWSAAGTQTHTLAGSFYAASGASVAPANSTFFFNASTTGKFVSASSSLTFYNMTMSGSGGTWNIGGVGTTSNNLTFSAGTTTLPSGTLAVGGTFDNSGGVFLHNSGVVKFTSTATGKNIRALTSAFANLEFDGVGGGWSFLDTNATATGAVLLKNGTTTLPTGVLAIGTDLNNQSGGVTANGGTIRMTATSSGRIIRMNGSSLANLFIADVGTFTFTDTNATATGDVIFASGTSTLPNAAFTVGGSFIATGTIAVATTSLVTFNPTSGTSLVALGNSTLTGVYVAGAPAATVNISASATTTGSMTIASGNFIQASSSALAVGGIFTNNLGGASTTWSGSRLALNSGTSLNMNSKTAGGDLYGIIRLGTNTIVRNWNSSAAAYELGTGTSVYAQDHAAVDGTLHIYGAYTRTTGTDYWSYATDFDGTALGGSSRQVNVRFGPSAAAAFSNASTLQMLGISTASTTVDRATTGNYGLSLSSSYINAQYYQFRNMNTAGLDMSGTTTITSLSNGDFELGLSGGSMITIASTTIDQNASGQIFYVRFATTTAIEGANVSRIGTTTNAITFASEYGNMALESRDNDGNDGCGSIRWTDSSCLFSDQRTYRWRNDNGAEGVPSTEWYDQNWSKRKRVRINNNATSSEVNIEVKFNVVYDSDMQSDFDDLRFTDSSGTTSIPYWIESLTAAASSTVWVKVPALPASGMADIFMYYGHATVAGGTSGTSTFKFFDDFEDGSMSEYSGNTTLFEQSTAFNYERTRGIDASLGNEASGKTTDGIGQMSAGVGRDTTIRFFQYIDIAAGGSNEPCFLFAIQSPITLHQNYAVCLTPFSGTDKVVIAKNAANNGRNDGATQLATTSVTYATGWYEASINWLSNNQINVTVYDSAGSVFATTSATDSSYTSGGIGFAYWGQHGGWDIPSAREYIATAPGAVFGLEQADSGATWKTAENTTLANQLINENLRLRVTVRNSGAPINNNNFRLQVAPKSVSPNCESVSGGSYVDVPTTSGAGCGSGAACMKTSTQFSDKSSTTQLLSIPTGQTFTYGQILEDPSNQTGNVSLASGEFTEVEYNFQMTAFASQDAYCFRTTNSGSALDNYTKVAELRILHAPVLSNFSFNNNASIALTEGATTTIFATSTVTDYNGYADLSFASSTFFRSGLSSSTACTADNNNCYQISTSSCSFINCSGNSCTVSCTADMYYFADPTDFGSTFVAENWQALIDVWDTSNSHARASSSQDVYTLKGLTIPSSLNYGSITVGADTGAANSTTTVTNTGNTILNLLLSGSPMTAASSTIAVNQQKYATSTFTYSGCAGCNLLATTSNPYNIGVTKPTSTNPFFKDVYWGLGVPNGTAATTHSGTNYFIAN